MQCKFCHEEMGDEIFAGVYEGGVSLCENCGATYIDIGPGTDEWRQIPDAVVDRVVLAVDEFIRKGSWRGIDDLPEVIRRTVQYEKCAE